MQSLLRTRPENLDDLTVQVALVRPGPIQGKAVHPYIEHRQRLREDPEFVPPVDHPLLAEPLQGDASASSSSRTRCSRWRLRSPGFSVGEAEGLRRAMSRKRSEAAIEAFRGRFVEGAVAKGVEAKLADAVYDKLVGFSGFGFPKSHAAAFGLLAYQSAWLRHHYPAEFLCALLNAQPMGFYPPASLVRDAQKRGVEVRPPHVNVSEAKCSIEDGAVRIGFEYIASIGEDGCEGTRRDGIAAGRSTIVVSLAQRTSLSQDGLESLIASGACDSLGESRRALLWELGLVPRSQSVPGSGGEERQLALPLDPTAETPELRKPSEWERMLADYRQTSLSIGVHPMELLRPHLPEGVLSSHDLCLAPDRARVAVAGMAVARQRPRPANGVVFMLLEDEFGQMNLIVPPPVYERHRAIVRGEPLVLAHGTFERVERNQNVVVQSARVAGSDRPQALRRGRPRLGAPGGPPLRPPLGSAHAAPAHLSPFFSASRRSRLPHPAAEAAEAGPSYSGAEPETWAATVCGALGDWAQGLQAESKQLGTELARRDEHCNGEDEVRRLPRERRAELGDDGQQDQGAGAPAVKDGEAIQQRAPERAREGSIELHPRDRAGEEAVDDRRSGVLVGVSDLGQDVERELTATGEEFNTLGDKYDDDDPERGDLERAGLHETSATSAS